MAAGGHLLNETPLPYLFSSMEFTYIFTRKSTYTELPVSNPWLSDAILVVVYTQKKVKLQLSAAMGLPPRTVFGGPVSLSTLFYAHNSKGYGKASWARTWSGFLLGNIGCRCLQLPGAGREGDKVVFFSKNSLSPHILEPVHVIAPGTSF